MERIELSDLIRIVKGGIIQQGRTRYIESVITDSRLKNENGLFIPLIGEKTDGHRYIPQAIENGTAAVVTEKEITVENAQPWIIKVDSTYDTLKQIAGFNRDRCNIPIVGITGSSGKTTTKDIVASVIVQKYHTLKTQGNFNNEIGVPLTLLRLLPSHEVAVIEMGMDHFGDIHKVISIVKPQYRVITNIGTAHLERLKTQENILKAKSEIFEMMQPEDVAVLNGDDPYLNTVKLEQRIIRVGIHNDGLDYQAKDVHVDSGKIFFIVDGEQYYFNIPGIHNVYNALTAIAIAKDMGMTQKEIQQGFDAFEPSGNRMFEEVINGVKYIDDSYNANPDAVKAALEVLKNKRSNAGRNIVVLGDMLELGTLSEQLHVEVGRLIPNAADLLIAVGEAAKGYVKGALTEMNADHVIHCSDYSEAIAILEGWARTGDTVLIKGSHGIHLENVLKTIREKRHDNQ